jgi:hypothetical protein
MPFGMSMGAGGQHLFQQHLGNGPAQRSSQHRNLRKLTTAAAAATAGVAGMHMYRTGKLPQLPQLKPAAKGAQQPLVQIPRELAEVICGAVGEIVQVAVLYPLDTIKVSPWDLTVAAKLLPRVPPPCTPVACCVAGMHLLLHAAGWDCCIAAACSPHASFWPQCTTRPPLPGTLWLWWTA